ncbi:MAG: hypothetical protein N2038_12180, partial [Geminicoccaceae bacterium]|nr:hypothetical protein [Geminicoccaceae bacterium]
MLGIHGDPVKARRTGEAMKRRGEPLNELSIYGYPRAFKCLPRLSDRTWFGAQRQRADLPFDISVLDPTAGGGSIP